MNYKKLLLGLILQCFLCTNYTEATKTLDKSIQTEKKESQSISEEISSFLNNLDNQIAQGQSPAQKEAIKNNHIVKTVNELFPARPFIKAFLKSHIIHSLHHYWLQNISQSFKSSSSFYMNYKNLELLPLSQKQAPKTHHTIQEIFKKMNLGINEEFQIMILRGSFISEAQIALLPFLKIKEKLCTIILTEELLKEENDNAIKGVIGHELAHAKCKHLPKLIQAHSKTSKISATLALLAMAVIGITGWFIS